MSDDDYRLFNATTDQQALPIKVMREIGEFLRHNGIPHDLAFYLLLNLAGAELALGKPRDWRKRQKRSHEVVTAARKYFLEHNPAVAAPTASTAVH